MRAYLERIEPANDCYRFYSVMVMPTLFGEWSILREWGRIGQAGTVRLTGFSTEDQAVSTAKDLLAAKRRRGYADR